MTGLEWLAGRKVLVVEDEYFLADDVAKGLEANGAEVIGPVGDKDDALDLIEDSEGLDAAVLDLNLRGEMAFPVADALLERGVPFIFATGYDQAVIPARYGEVTRCEKPVDGPKIARALFG
jgi:DNA-binding response OmpR family regulator